MLALVWVGLELGFCAFDAVQENIEAEFEALHGKTRQHIEEQGL
jgi:hypothetical protein